MNGLAILNVGDGDTKISFDPKYPAEREKAARIVGDLLKRGYALLVEVGQQDGEPLYQRAKRFDPERCEYIVAFEPTESTDEQEKPRAPAQIAASPEPAPKPRRSKAAERRLPAATTRAVAVARSAGG